MGSQPRPARRYVLLGASNLARSCSTIVQLLHSRTPEPVELWGAWGRGRSFGINSYLLGRELPGIVQCGLWPALDRAPAAPLLALVTDVGNDLLYGVEPEQAARWVETCLERLAAHDARVVMTGLPVENVAGLSPFRFALFRRLFFPGKPITFAEILSRVRRLDALLRDLGKKFSATWIEPKRGWYGFDPIHVLRRHWSVAWSEIFSAWNDEATARAARAQPWQWLRLQLMVPETRKFWGFSQCRAQPVARFGERFTLSLY